MNNHSVYLPADLDSAASQLLEMALYGDRGNEAKMTREILRVLREFAAGLSTATPATQSDPK